MVALRRGIDVDHSLLLDLHWSGRIAPEPDLLRDRSAGNALKIVHPPTRFTGSGVD